MPGLIGAKHYHQGFLFAVRTAASAAEASVEMRKCRQASSNSTSFIPGLCFPRLMVFLSVWSPFHKQCCGRMCNWTKMLGIGLKPSQHANSCEANGISSWNTKVDTQKPYTMIMQTCFVNGGLMARSWHRDQARPCRIPGLEKSADVRVRRVVDQSVQTEWAKAVSIQTCTCS